MYLILVGKSYKTVLPEYSKEKQNKKQHMEME